VEVKKWDERFLDTAKFIGAWSKDPSTKLGSVAVIDQRVVSAGYNGFPRGVYDLEYRLSDRETKLKYMVHAEMNCIYNAARNGVSLTGAVLYVDGLATCSECAKGVIQSGIAGVVMRYKPMKSMWAASFEFTKEMFNEANVWFECHEVKDVGSGIKSEQQADPGIEAERNVQEARGVGHRHGSKADIFRELDPGRWPGFTPAGPMEFIRNHSS
jgi:dCMP deaminase